MTKAGPVQRDPKVSVVIPVWNPGPGIARCLRSLQEQTLQEIEMIFVDDLDPDDYVAADFLELLYREACRGDFDIVKGERIRQREDGSCARLDTTLNQSIRSGLAAGGALYRLFWYEHQTAIFRRDFFWLPPRSFSGIRNISGMCCLC